MAAEGSGTLRVAVVGAGAFGRNHLRVLRELQVAGEAVELVAVVDRDAAVAGAAAERYQIAAFAGCRGDAGGRGKA